MNKNLKKIIAIALTVSAVSAVAPASIANYNLLSTKVYASSNDDSNDDKLDKISLETSGNKDIQLYNDDDYKSSHKIDDDEISDGDTYYAKSSKKTISISTSGTKSKFVRVFKGTSSSSKGYKTSKDIDLSSGTNTITVKVYSEEPSSTPRLGDDDDVIATYKIKVKYTGSDSDSDDSDSSQDSIYLDSISLSDGDINFNRKTSTYNVKVKSDVDEITIKAKPENEDDYTVNIDDHSVDDDDNWKHTVDLKKGKNKIEIVVEDNDDNKRTYTLNITRGDVAATPDSIFLDSLSVGATDLTLSENKKEWNLKFDEDTKKIAIAADPKSADYTVTIDGNTVDDGDSYKKSVELEDGEVKTFKVKVKNTSGTEQVYTLNIGRGNVPNSKFPAINNTASNNANANTNVTTSTQAKKTGWVPVNGNWQYYDGNGNMMKNSWIHYDKDGQDYYLDENGNMVTYWKKINGNWYYFSYDGAKKTGWQYDGKAWYYMDQSGVMLHDTYVGRYKLGSSGAWIQ